MSLGKYLWSETEDGVYSHIPAGTEAHFDKMDVTVESNYPWDGKVIYHVTGKTEEETILGIHIPILGTPGFCSGAYKWKSERYHCRCGKWISDS